MLQIYQTDDSGILMGDGLLREVHSKGHRQVLVAPPVRASEQLARWVTALCPLRDTLNYGDSGTGDWVLEADHRKTTLYQTADGQTYTVGTETEQGTYAGHGDLPAWLSTTARPSRFYNWVSKKWKLDAAAELADAKATERAWRDGEISKHAWLRERHGDELLQELPTTLNEAQHTELLTYVQQLRDWPAHADFPLLTSRPSVPNWLAD